MERELSKVEKAWLRKMQKVLDECPTTLGFYTIGDPYLQVYDLGKEEEINSTQERDFCTAVEQVGAELGMLRFPTNVHSTAG